MRIFMMVAALGAVGWAQSSWAAVENESERELVHACIDQASSHLEVSAVVLKLLYRLEGGTIGKVSQWSEGNFDIGPMQINNWWLPRLAKAGFTLNELRDSACTNVFVGAWIFKGELTRANGDVARAIARYHSPTPERQAIYLARASAQLERMIEASGAHRSPNAGDVARVPPPPAAGAESASRAAHPPRLRTIAESAPP